MRRVVVAADALDGAGVLLDNGPVGRLEHLGDDVLAHIRLVFRRNDYKVEVFRCDTFGVLLVRKFPVVLDQSAKLHCCRQVHVHVVLAVPGDVKQGRHVPWLLLVGLDEFLGLESELWIISLE